MKTLILLAAAIVATGCIPEEFTNEAEVQSAVARCEMETGQECKMLALPLDAEVEGWDLYYSRVIRDE